MKRIFLIPVVLCMFLLGSSVEAQHFELPDEAPVDITYLREARNESPLVRVVYSRPEKESLQVFGEQVPYGEIWRTGANEATEIKFYNDVLFGDKKVKAGTYVMHTIPGEKEWTIILNSNTDTWGAFFYDPSKDVLRINVPSSQAEEIDIFSIGFKKSFKDNYMVLAWDKTRVNIPVTGSSRLLAKI